VTALADLSLISSGKVRDIYAVGDDKLLLVASDRVSTFDAVHPNEISSKGAVLTAISNFWFDRIAGLVPNHTVSVTEGVPAEVRGSAVLVRKLEMLPVECVVRGYLAGSGWAEYQESGTVCGVPLPEGLQESSQLPEPIFTPATKAEVGDHDENIDFDTACGVVGDRDLMTRVRALSIEIYKQGAEYARSRGIILADTKFEFGEDEDGVLTIGDEVLTPDSSRFWPADQYEPGKGQPSFDKQIVRDWAVSTGWDKTPPAPEIPAEIVNATRARYLEAYELLTGEPLESWLERTAA